MTTDQNINRSPIRVLIVEDDEDFAGLTKLRLEKARPGTFQIEICNTCRDAVLRLDSGGIDIILLDLWLPDNEGLFTLSAVQAGAPGVPIVILSAADDDSAAIEAIRLGALDYLVKQRVDGRALGRVLLQGIERHRWTGQFQHNLRTARSEAARLRQIIDHAADGLLVVSKDGIIQFANRSACSFFGKEAEALLGQPFGFPLNSGQNVEVDLTDIHGIQRIFNLKAVEATWKEESAQFVTMHDISEQKAISRVRKDVLKILTHDIKTPLSAILGFSELLRDSKLSDREAGFLDRIDANARAAVTMAENFVDTARIESGALDLNVEETPVNELVLGVVHRQESMARLRNVTIEISLAQIPVLRIDPQLVQRAITNLLSNAIKFSPLDGCVTVATFQDENAFGLFVEDQGPGIPEEKHPHLFQGLSLLAGAKHQSSGLGLFVVQRVVEAQGGTISLTTPDNGGSRFTIRFPTSLAVT